ncbi:hypothetical protein ACJQWK_00985 [Exserohilum turcicum]
MKLALVLATIAAVSSAAAVIPSELLVDKRQCLLNGFSCDGRIKGGNCCSGNCIGKRNQILRHYLSTRCFGETG